MKLLIQRLAHEMQGTPGTVLVVGAGTGAEIPLWRELGSPHLVLVEAHPRQAEELARRISSAHHEEVWPLAVVATPTAHATLQILNNPLYSSLKPPHELTRYYPNLRVVGQAEVAARSLSESIESLALDASSTHLLVVDAPGQAWDLLSATPVRLLQSFACIIVRCGMTPLYAGDRGRADIAGLLEKAGFDIELDDPDAIYPQATALLKRNDVRVRITHLEAQLRKREDEYTAQVKLGVERDARLQQLTQDHDGQTRLAGQHKTALEEATQRAGVQQKLADDRLAQLQKLIQERDAQTKLAVQFKADLDKTSQQLVEQQKLASGGQVQLQKLTQERDEQVKLAQQCKAEQGKASQQLAEQQKLASDRQAQLQKLTQEHEAQTSLATQLKADLDKASQQLAEQQKLASDRQAQLQKLTQERDEQTKLAAQLKADLDKTSKQNQDRGARIAQFESEHADLNQRQARLNQEMIKAEAQIDLIKDVLLREPGL
jgi:hypothetical protein